jgi:integrase/recombinase XerD
VVIGLRSVLRFLFVQGPTQLALAEAVPAVAGWRDGALPATLSVSDVSALLSSCDRGAPIGLRDFAILLLLARLGLRSAEVAGLELGDIHWRSGLIVIRRGKSRGPDPFPLPVEVGDAMVAYLKGARPRTVCRSVFLTGLARGAKFIPTR